MRFRFRYGLRWFLLLPLAVCIFLGLEKRRAQHQEDLASQLFAIKGTFVRSHRAFLPVKICDMLPNEYGKTITEVSGGGMAALSFRNPRYFATGLFDAGNIDIVSTRSLDRLFRLPAMRKVKTFRLVGSSVDDKLASTVAALPSCESIEVHGTSVTQTKYHPPTARFSSNGPQAVSQNHTLSLRITDDVQIFARAFEGDPEAVAKLLRLSKPDESTNDVIVDTLREVDSAGAISAARKTLSHAQPHVRMTATRYLSIRQDVDGLIDALDDEDDDIRRVAIRGVGYLPKGTARTNTRLREAMLALSNDSAPANRWSVIDWLPKSGDSRCFAVFVKALSDDHSTVRAAAARGLGTLGDARAIPHLEKLLDDSDPFVRKHAKASIYLTGK